MITQEQRLARQKFIGGSDAAPIFAHYMGKDLGCYQTIDDVYASKIYPLVEEEPNDAIVVGNYCENALLQYAADELNTKLEFSPATFVHPKYDFMGANLDAVPEQADPTWAVEAKTTGIVSYLPADKRAEFGEPMSDNVPLRFLIQCQHQMLVVPSLTYIILVVLVGLRGFVLYRIERDDELIAMLRHYETRFWHEHVLLKNPPTKDYQPPLSILKSIDRKEGTFVVSEEPKLLTRYIAAKEAVKAAQKEEDITRRALIAAFGDAAGILFPDGSRATYYEQRRGAYMVKETSFPVLRTYPAKEEKETK